MSKKISILLVGFGNIGQSVLKIFPQYPDMELVGIVTRRPEIVVREVKDSIPVCNLNTPQSYIGCGADVAIMCGGSKDDLPKQTPFFANYFNVVDSFDTHSHIGPYVEEITGQPMLGHLKTVDAICHNSKHTAHIGIGWDPGSFSLMRGFFKACFGDCRVNAFYGLTNQGGLSMGHTNALKSIPGVVDAKQYTHAKLEAIEKIRSGGDPNLSDREKHWRECKVVVAEGVDQNIIRKKIISMPVYFAPYDTTVEFVSQQELGSEKESMSHDGLVIATSPAGFMEFRNVWKSNPMGTAGFLLAYARATWRANLNGHYGCLTTLDTSIVDLLLEPSEKVGLI